MRILDQIEALRKNIHEIPIHTESTLRVVRPFSQKMPKNLFEYASEKMEDWINSNLAIIEEIGYRDQTNIIPKWFVNYYNQFYFSKGINHCKADSFIDSRLRDGFRKHLSPNLTEVREIGHYGNTRGLFNVFGKVNGAELTGGGTGSNSTSLVGLLNAIKLSIGVAGQYYDQIAFDWNAAAGNERLGVYDDLSNPNNLLVESSSAAVATGFGYKSVTEFALTTNQAWAAMCADDAGASAKYTTVGGNLRVTRSFTYGALPNPFGGTPSADNANINCKVGHS